MIIKKTINQDQLKQTSDMQRLLHILVIKSIRASFQSKSLSQNIQMAEFISALSELLCLR